MSYPIRFPIGSPAPLASVHHPTPTTWELEMHHGLDNRINHEFIDKVLLKALDHVEKDWRSSTTEVGAPGALIIVGTKSQQKFFSNGLDFEGRSGTMDSSPVCTVLLAFRHICSPLGTRLLRPVDEATYRFPNMFSVPIIAAINGHCFAAAFALALTCDYRVMTSGKAWCCMTEVELGASLPPSVAAVVNYRLPNARIARDATLDAHRFTPQELHALGVIDVLADGGTDGVLREAHKLAEAKAARAKTGVYGLMRTDMLKAVFNAAKLDERRAMACGCGGPRSRTTVAARLSIIYACTIK
ncbi:hypothetical protein BS47DRAFT_1302622 [Hydnum rufescens UP504]|uniref:ClpP/crotonase n=1 Tax=Hydnum rufescens UP504 TaxID=1448309 RepID=A0A9P6APK7_9AGAM|nr:hypothetical protein BS47DRAFT_1302622 [Hydnum rufescens UP504]